MELKKGKLFVIEGLDGCGKETQKKLLYSALTAMNYKVKMLSFPNYDSPTSALVKMYLQGDFGGDASLINAFQSSSFYAVDRLGTYLIEMKDFLIKKKGIIICDRYTTSNILYQSSKIEREKDKLEFLDWIVDFEYNKLGLPIPNETFFLNVELNIFLKNIKRRSDNKHGGQDIHESNQKYLETVYENAQNIINKFHWKTISCENELGDLKDKEVISKDILNHVLKIIDSD